MKEWLTCAEIAALMLPTVPTTERAVRYLAERAQWPSRPREARGGGLEYHWSALPPEAQAAFHRLQAPDAPVPALPATSQVVVDHKFPARRALADWQRDCMQARLALLQELDRFAGVMGVNKAIDTMVSLAADRTLREPLRSMVPVANRCTGADGARTLSRRTLLRWKALARKGSEALAPGARPNVLPPPWAAALLRAWGQPQKPSLLAALETLAAVLPPGVEMPSQHAARRFLKKMSVIDLNRGRMGPRELKSLKSFKRRDVEALQPLDVCVMDGHQFDAEVAHPAHGRPFRPEITGIIDAATRKLVGWSTGLAESAQAVMDTLRHAATSHGVMAILYVDNGSGYEADVVSNAVTGLLAQLGVRHERSLPYNSQARGLIERSHRTIWVRGAKQFLTFIGADMDAEAAKKVHKLTRKEINGSRPLLLPWRDYLAWAEQQVAVYNARPHGGLPKLRDAATGKLRHQSPDEAWAAWVERGWTPTMISKPEAHDLFRPVREVKTRRGEVVLFGNIYFHAELHHRHGERVQVAYDIHDVSDVQVRDLQGKPLCTAALDGNKRHFFPKSVVEQARERRALGRARRLEGHLEEVRQELIGTVIDGGVQPLSAETEALAAEQLQKLLPPPANDARDTSFDSDEGFYHWYLAHKSEANDWQHEYFADLIKSKNFQLLIGIGADGGANAGE